MVNNVIDFPSKAIRDEKLFVSTMREILQKTELAPESVEELIQARLLPIWERYQHKLPISLPSLPPFLSDEQRTLISSSFADQLKIFEEHLHEFTNSLIIDRINAEIQLYLLGG